MAECVDVKRKWMGFYDQELSDDFPQSIRSLQGLASTSQCLEAACVPAEYKEGTQYMSTLQAGRKEYC